MKALVAAVLTLLASTPVHAEGFYTIGDGVRVCEDESPEINFCYGYISGFLDGMMPLLLMSMKGPYICPPDGATFNQLRKVFLKWAAENPERLHEEIRFGFSSAFAKAFPCPP